jgi:TatA/E family protein of Tat protein translocase
MPDIGVPELLIVLVVAFLLFGAKKLPELARSIGRSTSEFKKGIREGEAHEEAPAASPAASKETEPRPPETSEASE